MSKIDEIRAQPGFNFLSSVEQDAWSGMKSGSAYEWWYFDALSDDASEGVVVIFLDNFVFSPRYNKMCEQLSGSNGSHVTKTYPAVVFVYYRDGKPVYRSICEYNQSEMEADLDIPRVRIGSSSFEYTSAPYGTGYVVKIDVPLPRGKRLVADIEWLSIESDLSGKSPDAKSGHTWNMVAPRSDVSGRITVIDRKLRRKKIKLRGTGYHDHNSDKRWMPETIEKWYWGRVHFPFATAVFYHYKEKSISEEVSKLILVRDGQVEHFDASARMIGGKGRDKFGLSYPRAILVEADGLELTIDESSVIDSSFFYLRFLSRMKLRNSGREKEAVGISEYLRPERLRNRWLARLTSFRIGKDGKSAFLP